MKSALLTDLYQLTMLQAYWQQQRMGEAVFSLYFRHLPANRNYMLAAGLVSVLDFLESVAFSREDIDYLATLPQFDDDFLAWLADFGFSGDVYAMHEGTPVFPDEPLLEVVAPLPQAQLVESFIMNQVHCQTVLASKAARIVAAARGRPVLDFAMRRMHGEDAALTGARAFYIAGMTASSNLAAGRRFGVPVAGTMAHSYIQSAPDELQAFRDYLSLYPETVLLVDTYDVRTAVKRIIGLARELGPDFRLRAIRLDSGDLARQACEARELLDAAGLHRVQIFASGGLDEYAIDDMLEQKAPVDAFGVGTAMGTAEDAPALDLAYKLGEYAGRDRLKVSPGKLTLPGRKQVYRMFEEGEAVGDHVCAADEQRDGLALLHQVMEGGERLPAAGMGLEDIRAHARAAIDALPHELKSLDDCEPYPVQISTKLRERQAAAMAGITRGGR